jgi:hypothetical protein
MFLDFQQALFYVKTLALQHEAMHSSQAKIHILFDRQQQSRKIT